MTKTTATLQVIAGNHRQGAFSTFVLGPGELRLVVRSPCDDVQVRVAVDDLGRLEVLEPQQARKVTP